jgi:DnaJ domain
VDLDNARTVLGIGATADRDEAHEAYKRRARLLHPDLQIEDAGLRAEADSAMKQLNEAWQTLSTTKGSPGSAPEPTSPVPTTSGAPTMLPWPTSPTEEQALRLVQAHLCAERFVTANAVTTITGVTDASIPTWTLRTLIEGRHEDWTTFPGEFAPAPAECYDGDLSGVDLPDATGREEQFTIFRNDSLSRNACPDCKGGQRRCPRCVGLGRVICPKTETCSVCSGRGTTVTYAANATAQTQACVRCSGTGQATCHRCQGSGFRPCWECAGRGQIPCRTCQATGMLTNVLVGTITRSWHTESLPGYDAESLAAQASVHAAKAAGVVTAQVDPALIPGDVPAAVVTAVTPMLSRRSGELRRSLVLEVTPAVRVEADGADGAQTVWLVGNPPTVTVPASEQHRKQRRSGWLQQVGIRIVLAVVAGAAAFGLLVLVVAALLAVIVGVAVSVLLGLLFCRPLISTARKSNASAVSGASARLGLGAPVSRSPATAADRTESR